MNRVEPIRNRCRAAGCLGQTDTASVTVNLPASVSCQYDANGNFASDGHYNYVYSTENELLQVRTLDGLQYSNFSYDGLGRLRLRKDQAWINSVWVTTNEVRYIYAGKLVLQ